MPVGTIKLNQVDNGYRLIHSQHRLEKDINTFFIYYSPHAKYYYNQIKTYIHEMSFDKKETIDLTTSIRSKLPITKIRHHSNLYDVNDLELTIKLFNDIINDEQYLIHDLYIDRYMLVKPYDSKLLYRIYVSYKFVPIYCASDYYLQRFGYDHSINTGSISSISITKRKLGFTIEQHEASPNIEQFKQTLANFQEIDPLYQGVIFISTFNSSRNKTFTIDPNEFEIIRV